MKFVQICPSYLPEISGGNHLRIDLIEDAALNGDEVVLIAPFPHRVSEEVKREYESRLNEILCDGKVSIHRIRCHFGEKNLLDRALRMSELSLKMVARGFLEKNTDAVISHSMPVFLGPLSAIMGKFRGIPVIYWEQDIVSNSIKSTRLFAQNAILSRVKTESLFHIARGMERITSKLSTHVITISQDFVQRQVKEFGASSKKVSLLYNWIDVNQVHPVPRSDNFLFDKYHLSRDKFYVTYAGTLGLPQNVEVLVDAARMLQKYPDFHVVIFGGGVREKAIQKYVKELALPNVSIFPLEPLEHAAEVYSLGDVGLVIGKAGTSQNGFPSKTWSILAAGQALVTCFDEGSELTNIVQNSDCGVWVPPDSPDDLARVLEKLYLNREETSAMGRRARVVAIQEHSRSVATASFWNTIKNIVANYK